MHRSVKEGSWHHPIDGKDGICSGQHPCRELRFDLVKSELVSRLKFPTRQAARTAIFDYLEAFYNTLADCTRLSRLQKALKTLRRIE